VDPNNILGAFPDLAAVAEECPRGCTHLGDSPDCSINDALERGELSENASVRIDSMQRLLTTFETLGN
jgi:ribosome biogenesis GTPase